MLEAWGFHLGPGPASTYSHTMTRNGSRPFPPNQVGCRNGGAWYKDYEMIGGQHRCVVCLGYALAWG